MIVILVPASGAGVRLMDGHAETRGVIARQPSQLVREPSRGERLQQILDFQRPRDRRGDDQISALAGQWNMTGLGTRHTWPRSPSSASTRTRAKPCDGASQTRHRTTHSASGRWGARERAWPNSTAHEAATLACELEAQRQRSRLSLARAEVDRSTGIWGLSTMSYASASVRSRWISAEGDVVLSKRPAG